MVKNNANMKTGEISYKNRLLELRTMQCLPLHKKIEQTKARLSSILQQHRRPIIAWSGGKDSTILLQMALDLNPNIDVAWCNTGVEFPECIHFVLEMRSKWNLNLHIAKPETTFWKVVDKFGWPILGKGSSGGWQSRAAYLERKGKHRLAKATRDAKIAAACCRLLKQKPCDKLYSELEIDCVILGNMVAESRQRFLIWAQKGDYYYATAEGRYKAWPMAAWTEEDVWEYHTIFGLSHSKIYDMGHRRNGCWPCLMDFRYSDNKLKALRLSHPKLWNLIIVKKGLGKRLIALKLALNEEEHEAFTEERLDRNVTWLIQQRPCYFDSL